GTVWKSVVKGRASHSLHRERCSNQPEGCYTLMRSQETRPACVTAQRDECEMMGLTLWTNIQS
ncbi:uncharacterized, partial [Tachysurus ichikawai]